MNSKCTIVMYHYVRPIANSRYPGIKGLEYNFFKEQIEFLAKNFNFVSCADIRNALKGEKELPCNAALLTFDDGYIDHYTNVFPVLKQYGISGLFSMPAKIRAEKKLLDVNKIHYILASAETKDIIPELKKQLETYSGIPPFAELYAKYATANRFDTADTIFVKRILQTVLSEKIRNSVTNELFRMYVSKSESSFVDELYMTMEQIRLMKDSGMEFGIHGFDHSWLGNLPRKDAQKDIIKALDFYDGIIDRNDWVMCFPYGSYSPEVVSFCRTHGATIGFSTEVRIANLAADNPLTLPRLDTNDFPPKSTRYLEIP